MLHRELEASVLMGAGRRGGEAVFGRHSVRDLFWVKSASCRVSSAMNSVGSDKYFVDGKELIFAWGMRFFHVSRREIKTTLVHFGIFCAQ